MEDRTMRKTTIAGIAGILALPVYLILMCMFVVPAPKYRGKMAASWGVGISRAVEAHNGNGR